MRISRKGWTAMESLTPLLQQINDISFDLESREEFAALCAIFGRLVESSKRALALVTEGAVTSIHRFGT